jgi:hypothetical protein
MNTDEIIKEIELLPIRKRIYIMEKTLHSIRNQEDKYQMERAVDAVLPDYVSDSELTVFSNLDYEDFYEN